jgi:hypothetical protein
VAQAWAGRAFEEGSLKEKCAVSSAVAALLTHAIIGDNGRDGGEEPFGPCPECLNVVRRAQQNGLLTLLPVESSTDGPPRPTPDEKATAALSKAFSIARVKSALLMKKTALEVATKGPSANPAYCREQDRVEKMRCAQRQLVDDHANNYANQRSLWNARAQRLIEHQHRVNDDGEASIRRMVSDALAVAESQKQI